MITENNRDRNDDLSEISSSVNTSYKYRKRKTDFILHLPSFLQFIIN